MNATDTIWETILKRFVEVTFVGNEATGLKHYKIELRRGAPREWCIAIMPDFPGLDNSEQRLRDIMNDMTDDGIEYRKHLIEAGYRVGEPFKVTPRGLVFFLETELVEGAKP